MIDVKKLAEQAGALADKEIQKPGYPSEKWQEFRDRHLAALVLAEALKACLAVRTLAEFQSMDHCGMYAEEIKGSQDCVMVIDQIIDMVLGQDGDFRAALAIGKLMTWKPAKEQKT